MTSSARQSARMCDDVVMEESRKVRVTILASEWGSSKGGISTINRELAIQLAKYLEVEITFFLPQCSLEERKIAQEHNVKIVEWLSFPPEHLQIDIIVGHGARLGKQAQIIKEFKKCRWVQVVHTDPEELGMFKNYSNPISKGEEKHKIEVELCEMADHVVGVGPKLSEAFRSYLRSCEKDVNVLDFTPGVFEEFKNLKQVPGERQQRSVLVFGRGDAEDFELKGFDIAGTAVAALHDTRLVFAGAPDGKHEEIAKRLTGCGVPASRLRVRGYFQDRESLKRLFHEVDLAVMPSRTEGFGLTGLEALSAGLPVLISGNSGFGEALSKVPFGSTFVIHSEDPVDWTEAIKNIWAKDRKCRLDEVETLRDCYDKKYNWAQQAKDLVEKMTSWVQDFPHPKICQLYRTPEQRLLPITWLDDFSFHLNDIFTRLKIVSKEKARGIPTDDTASVTAVYNTHAECLDLSRSVIGASGAASLSQVLAGLAANSLTQVNLKWNKIGDSGAFSLSQALAANSSLTHLDLSSGEIGAFGAFSLSQALAANSSLTRLDLQRNSIGVSGATSLSRTLATNSSLTHLDLSFNRIRDSGAAFLAQALATNSSLTHLDLSYNGISASGAASLSQALTVNSSLTYLDLSWNNIGTSGAASLSQSLTVNSFLTHLDLRDNSISASGAASLSQALTVNSSLTHLDLRDNMIGASGAASLSQALAVNSSLTHLKLSSNNNWRFWCCFSVLGSCSQLLCKSFGFGQ